MNITRYILVLGVTILAALMLIIGFHQPVEAQAQPVIITVSQFRAAPGDLVRIPIYIRGADQTLNTLSFDLVYPRKVLKFENLVVDETLLWNANGFFDHIRVESRVEAKFDNAAVNKDGILVFALFTVIGDKGSAGFITIENPVFPELLEEPLVIGSTFRVLPTVTYLSDRNILEITSRDVFTSFRLELAGTLDIVEGQSGDWKVVEESVGVVIGTSGTAGDGVTQISIPVKEGSEFQIFTLMLDNDSPVLFARRQYLLPSITR